jgi:hypothetical protein
VFLEGFSVLAPQSIWGAIFISRVAGLLAAKQLGWALCLASWTVAATGIVVAPSNRLTRTGGHPHIKYRFASRFPPVVSRRDREILPSRDEGNMGR